MSTKSSKDSTRIRPEWAGQPFFEEDNSSFVGWFAFAAVLILGGLIAIRWVIK